MSLTDYSRTMRPSYTVRFGLARTKTMEEATNVMRITTQKSLGEAAGAWEVVLDGSRISPTGSGRWFDVIVPNDYCEMYLGADSAYPERIAMRGWVDNIRIGESGEGRGTRSIVASGKDYGNVWIVARMLNLYPPLIPPSQIYGYYDLAAELNAPGFVEHVTLWDKVMKNVVTPYVTLQQQRINPAIPSFTYPTDIPTGLLLTEVQTSAALGPMFTFLQLHQQIPWQEMFVRDEDDAPAFHLRWAKTRSSDGKFYAPVGPPPTPPTLTPVTDELDDITDNIGLSQNEVFNWFATINTAFGTVDADALLAVLAPQNPYIVGSSIDAYGERPLEPNLNYTPTKIGDTEEAQKQAQLDLRTLTEQFNIWLVRMLSFNYALLNGTMTTLGNPAFRVGDEILHLNADQGGRVYYIEGVGHSYTEPVDGHPTSGSFVTNLTLTRGMPYNDGTGFGLDYQTISPFSIPTSNAGIQSAANGIANSLHSPLGSPTPAISPTLP